MTGFLLFMALLAFALVGIFGIVGGSMIHEDGDEETGVVVFSVGVAGAILAIFDLIYLIAGNYS